MLETPLVFVDIETNGGTGARGRVIEVAAIKVEGGEIIDTFTSLVNPGHDIPAWITQLTGITNGDLAQAPYFSDIAEQLHRFMQGAVFVAHNVLFDYSFLKREFREAGYLFTPPLFCTVKMSRALYPEHRGHSLEKIIQRHSIPVASRHRAYDDAHAMYQYVQLTLASKGADAVVANFHHQTKTKSLPPQVDPEVIRSLPQTAGVYIFEDDNGLPLYVGKSVNIRARVRSHFTSATTIAKEMRLSLASHNVSYIATATELEALLLESAKVKELQPIFNRKLRRQRSQHILHKSLGEDGYTRIGILSTDLSHYTDLQHVYGVFTSKAQAKSSLESIMRTYQLCPKLLGLEKSRTACFRYQLGLCKGACTGKESATSYNSRVELALSRTKLETWPFRTRIAVTISPTRSLVIDQWIPQAIVDHDDDSFQELYHEFDLDTYKIIRSYLRNHPHTVREMPGA